MEDSHINDRSRHGKAGRVLSEDSLAGSCSTQVLISIIAAAVFILNDNISCNTGFVIVAVGILIAGCYIDGREVPLGVAASVLSHINFYAIGVVITSLEIRESSSVSTVSAL